MFDTRRYEHEIAGPKRIASAVVSEHSSTANDEVDLVLRVRRLRARLLRNGESNIQWASPKSADSVLGRRYRRLSLGDAENTTTI